MKRQKELAPAVLKLSRHHSAFLRDLPDVAFYFFDKSVLRKIAAIVGGLSICGQIPEIREVDNAIVTPPFAKAGRCTAGVFDSEHRLVVGGRSEFGHELDPADLVLAPTDSRTAVYVGGVRWHYGHFLLETLPRLWPWWTIPDDFVALMPSHSHLRGIPRSICTLLPNFDKRISFPRRPTRFRTVLIPEPAFAIRRKAYREFKTFCDRIAAQVLSADVERTDQPLYLSRKGLGPSAGRAIVGEDRLEQFLEKEGFLVVQPEILTIAEQITMFNRHKWIVSPMGSACHTRLFSRRPINLVTLTGEIMLTRFHNYLLCDSISDGTAHYANVLSVPDMGVGPNAVWQPVILMEVEFLDLLTSLGLIRPGSSPAGSRPDIEAYWQRWAAMAEREAQRTKDKRLLDILATGPIGAGAVASVWL